MKLDLPGHGIRETPYSDRLDDDWPTCACCGVSLPADGDWCAACWDAECGERDEATCERDGCLAKGGGK